MEKVRREKRKDGESQKREDAGARVGRKAARHCVFPIFCGSGGSKVGSLKRRVRSALARWEMNNCTPLWRKAHSFKYIVSKHTMLGPLLEVEMLKKCTPLWREAHFFKYIVSKHGRSGPLLEVEMLKKWTPLWREAHLEVKMYKTPRHLSVQWLLEAEISARRWREAHLEVKMYPTPGFGPFLDLQMAKKCTPLLREAYFQVKSVKDCRFLSQFWGVT